MTMFNAIWISEPVYNVRECGLTLPVEGHNVWQPDVLDWSEVRNYKSARRLLRELNGVMRRIKSQKKNLTK